MELVVGGDVSCSAGLVFEDTTSEGEGEDAIELSLIEGVSLTRKYSAEWMTIFTLCLVEELTFTT